MKQTQQDVRTRGHSAGTIVLSLTAVSLSSGVFAGTPMPPGAFLHTPAQSPNALSHEATVDRTVCERYARLYNMPLDEVPAALASLRLTRTTSDTVVQVHYVAPGEQIGYKVRRIRKGTPVYVLPDGTPAMVEVCGNPIRNVLPASITRSFPSQPAYPSNSIADFSPDEPLVPVSSALVAPESGLRGVMPPSLSGIPGFVVLPNIVPVTSLPTATSSTELVNHAPVSHISGFNGAGLLLPLVGLAGLGALLGGHSSNGSSAPAGGGTTPGGGGGTSPGGGGGTSTAGGGVGPLSIPEPGVVVMMLSMGSVGALTLHRKARRTRK